MEDKGYESHITFDKKFAYHVERSRLAQEFGWKYSQIDGDPLLGKAVHCYLTGHSADYDVIYEQMITLISHFQGCNCPPLRGKIEHIVFDWRIQ